MPMYPEPVTARHVVERVLESMDRLPQPDEERAEPSDVLESPSGTLALSSLLQWLREGENLLADTCKAQHLGALDASYQGAADALDGGLVRRLLHNTVERYDAARGVWEPSALATEGAVHRMESAGRAPTPRHPVHTWNGYELRSYPLSGEEAPQVRLRYVRAAPLLTAQQHNAGAEVHVSPQLEGALVAYVASRAEAQLQEGTRSSEDAQASAFLGRPFLLSHRLGRPDEYAAGRRLDEREVSTE